LFLGTLDELIVGDCGRAAILPLVLLAKGLQIKFALTAHRCRWIVYLVEGLQVFVDLLRDVGPWILLDQVKKGINRSWRLVDEH
jgi:hypothetical protein